VIVTLLRVVRFVAVPEGIRGDQGGKGNNSKSLFVHGSSNCNMRAQGRAGTAHLNAPRRCQRSERAGRTVELFGLDAGN
jgi:hypothetical protein